jgi:hypothetical protein
MVIKRKAARKSSNARAAAGVSKPLAIATNKQKGVPERIMALSQAPLNVTENNLEKIMVVLGDADEPIEVRLAALQSLQAASFNVTAFEPSSGKYRTTLRKVAHDANPELRQQALAALAQQKDGFAQKRLLQGLQDPGKALVPPEKALALLGYDLHADAYKAARAIVENPPSPVAKREALRLLAADPTSAQMFEKILLDKDELRENRQVSATALHSLEPDRFQGLARNIVLDSSDYDDIQATSLTALTQFGDEAKVATDQSLRQSVDRMKTKGSAKLQQSAKQFLSRYRG